MAFNRYSLDMELGSSQYVTRTTACTNLGITGDLTIEFWVRHETVTGTKSYVLYDPATSGVALTYQIYHDGTNLGFYHHNGTNSDNPTVAWTPVVGKWYHIALTISSTTLKFWVNGVQQGSNQTLSYSRTVTGTFDFFRLGNVSQYLDGMMNNVMVFNDARTQAEIQSDMFKYSISDANLQGHWRLNNDLADQSSNGYTLTAVNSPTYSTNVPFTGANSTDWAGVYHAKIDHTKVSGSANLTNFPMLIYNGALPNSVYDGLSFPAYDLRITLDANGEQEVPFEIVELDTGAYECEIWAKIPTVSYTVDTDLYFWYGNANATYYENSAPFGAHAVWSAHRRVQHSQSNSNDSTSYANNGTDTSITYSSANGKIGNGAGLDSNTDVTTITSINLSGTFVLSAWVKTGSTDATRANTISPALPLIVGTGSYTEFGIHGGKVQYNVYTTTWTYNDSTGSVNDDNWHYIQVVDTGTAQTFYIDGAASGTASRTRGGNGIWDRIGNVTSGGNIDWFDGEYDEIRIVNTSLTADWIATEYANQNSPTTFLIAATVTISFSETVTATDTLRRTIAKVFAESITATATMIQSIAARYTEAITATEAMIRSTHKAFVESITGSDSLIRSIAKEFDETFTVTDTFSSYLVIFRTFTESISITETMHRSIVVVFSEAITALDSMIQLTSKLFSEAIETTDSLFVTIGQIFVETIAVSVSMALVIAKAFTESISITVSLATLVILNFTESISSSISFNIGVAVRFVESLHITDTLTRWKNGIKILYEYFYTPRGSSYSDKHSAKGTTWTNKY